MNLTQAEVGKAPVVEGFGKLGIEADGLVIVFDRQLGLSHVEVGETSIVVGLSQLGVQQDSGAVVLYGLVRSLQLEVDPTAAVVSLGVAVVEDDCPVKFGESLLQTAPLHKLNARVEMRLRPAIASATQ